MSITRLISLVCLFGILAGCGDDGGSSSSTGTSSSGSSSTQLLGGAIQGKELSLSGVVTTFAGTYGSSSVTDGTGAAAFFNSPTRITTDGTNLYVAEWGAHVIRKIVISSGAVTTIAGVAGTPGSANGTGTAATFSYPNAITTDGTNLYIADGNCVIRKMVLSTGVVSIIAGTAGFSGSADGTGTGASFGTIRSLTTDGTYLYIADSGNNTIRKLELSSGVVTTIAGTAGASGSTDGTGSAALFNNVNGITTDGTNLYIADYGNHKIRKMEIASGVVTTIAGGSTSGSTDGTGTAALFNQPGAITCDGKNLYIADSANYTIRKMVLSSGVVTTIAGSAGVYGYLDATGTAAKFDTVLLGIATDGVSLFVPDYDNNTIRKIN